MLGAAVYFGLNMAMNYVFRKDQTGMTVTDPNTGNMVTVPSNMDIIPPFQLRPSELNEGATHRQLPRKVAPIWPQDAHVDIIVTLSPSFNPTPISKVPAEYVVLKEKDFHINNWTDTRVVETTFKVPKAVQNNGTLWSHIYVGLPGSNLDPREPGYDTTKAYHLSYPLTQYLPKKKTTKARNLLDDLPEPVQAEEEEPTGPIIANYYHPNASFSFVPDLGVKELGQLPPVAKHFLDRKSVV